MSREGWGEDRVEGGVAYEEGNEDDEDGGGGGGHGESCML